MLNEGEMCDAAVMVFCQEAGVAWCDDGGLKSLRSWVCTIEKAAMGHLTHLCRDRNLSPRRVEVLCEC